MKDLEYVIIAQHYIFSPYKQNSQYFSSSEFNVYGYNFWIDINQFQLQ